MVFFLLIQRPQIPSYLFPVFTWTMSETLIHQTNYPPSVFADQNVWEGWVLQPCGNLITTCIYIIWCVHFTIKDKHIIAD